MKNITIAIDGYAGCGKSTTAKAVARELGYRFIDSGAMYRAFTLWVLRHQIPYDSENPQLLAALPQSRIDFKLNPETGASHIHLGEEDVADHIRTPEVNASVSAVSAHKQVRKAIVAQQRELGKAGGIVMDGRDIGTVVFPDAELKVFMTADLEIRAKRRQAEMESKGITQSLEEVMKSLKERDRLDTTRKESPLRQAEDALVLDTSYTTIEDQVAQVITWAQARISA